MFMNVLFYMHKGNDEASNLGPGNLGMYLYFTDTKMRKNKCAHTHTHTHKTTFSDPLRFYLVSSKGKAKFP